eukprot:jgi/Bigna1/78173/fgenesh1_pg.53_\
MDTKHGIQADRAHARKGNHENEGFDTRPREHNDTDDIERSEAVGPKDESPEGFSKWMVGLKSWLGRGKSRTTARGRNEEHHSKKIPGLGVAVGLDDSPNNAAKRDELAAQRSTSGEWEDNDGLDRKEEVERAKFVGEKWKFEEQLRDAEYYIRKKSEEEETENLKKQALLSPLKGDCIP